MSLYDVSVPTFKRTLTSLDAILAKAEAYAEDKGIDPEVLVNARLAPNMFPLSRQIQIASDSARRGAGLLAQVEVPPIEDTEATIAELRDRIAQTVVFLDSLKKKQFKGAKKRTVELALGDTTLKLPATSFLMGFAMSNFSFHVVTAYNILRHNGVEIGKMDYLGAP